MSRAKMVDYFLEKSKEPNFQIDQVRKELEKNNIPEEEIKVIVRLVDNELQAKELIGSSNNKANELIIGGALLTIIGAGITIGTYTGIIDMGNSFLIVYGPFFGGIGMLLGGWAQRRKDNS